MIRGWCPTVHEPMQSGDGLLVRVKPFGGRLPAARLSALAEAVIRYGNGVVELTSRGNLQVRGVHNATAFARAMVDAGLADPDPQREARRNVITIPPCDDALVADLEERLARTEGLPPKFCFTVDKSGLLQAGTPHPVPSHEAHHLLYPPFGQTNAQTLGHLATLAGEIRTTPWRAFLSPVPAPGFATEPGTVTACPGAPACLSGTTSTRADAAQLEAAGHTNLHISGCAKGCAYPRAATTLVGRNGRYDLIRHGRASDPPDVLSLTLTEALAAL